MVKFPCSKCGSDGTVATIKISPQTEQNWEAEYSDSLCGDCFEEYLSERGKHELLIELEDDPHTRVGEP